MRKILIIVSLITIIWGCGGGTADNIADSVEVYLQNNREELDTAVYTWNDLNGNNTCERNELILYVSDTDDKIVTTITVVPLPNLPANISPSPIYVKKVDLTYIPLDVLSPQIPNTSQYIGEIIPPNGSKDIIVDIAGAEVKTFLRNNGYVVGCQIGIGYKYMVKLVFYMEEIYSGKEFTVESGVNLSILDTKVQ